MTRKDYVALAEALHKAQPTVLVGIMGTEYNESREAWRECVESIANVCAADNPRFDRDRFVRVAQGERV